MPLTAKEKSMPDIEPIPEGVSLATCYSVIDLGTHADPVYKKESRKVLIQWEIPEHRIEVERDGQPVNLPRAISKRYTLSLSEKANLRRDLQSWRGRTFTQAELDGFDLKNVLGVPCQIQIVHEAAKDGRVFANVGAIMALPKGTPRPKQENPSVFFSFEDQPADKVELPPNLPQWVTDIIIQSREWNERMMTGSAAPASDPANPNAPAPDDGEVIPF